jgi:hypothetical protein
MKRGQFFMTPPARSRSLQSFMWLPSPVPIVRQSLDIDGSSCHPPRLPECLPECRVEGCKSVSPCGHEGLMREIFRTCRRGPSKPPPIASLIACSMWVITPARELFYCFDAKVGGHCLALVQRITGLDVKDAAAFLSPTWSAHNSSSSTPNRWSSWALPRRRRKTSLSASTAARFIPIRHSGGSIISGFAGYADGQMKLPPKWLPATFHVVTVSKKSA